MSGVVTQKIRAWVASYYYVVRLYRVCILVIYVVLQPNYAFFMGEINRGIYRDTERQRERDVSYFFSKHGQERERVTDTERKKQKETHQILFVFPLERER